MKRGMILAGFVSAWMALNAVGGDAPKAGTDAPGGNAAQAATPECKLPRVSNDPQMARLKALAGAWQGSDEDKDGKPDGEVFYRVISNGSAVAEFLAPGEAHEMVSMYHMDNDDLVMTHYCSAGNQPRMKARAASPGAKELTFEFRDATNLKTPNDMHISGLVLTFVDDDHVVASWRGKANGKEMDHTVFKLERVKDAALAAKIAAKVGAPAAAPVGQSARS